jgi:putative hydrolase of the HAD superfamily
MSIRAVVFDIGGVLELTPSTGWIERWGKRLNRDLGEVFDELERMGLDSSLGLCTEKEWRAGLQTILGLDESQTDEFMGDLWHEYLGTLNVELVEYFRSLRPKYQTAIISNSFVGAREKEAEAYQFDTICDFIIYSHEVGLSKPDPRIFTLACERLGLKPSEVIFVDDHPEVFTSAVEMGMHCIEFKDNTQVIVAIETCIQNNQDS